MFARSLGSISQTVCLHKTISFASKAELDSAVEACLKLDPKGDCINGPNGPIAEWDVSKVTSMREMFLSAILFTSDISKWDVSSAQDMSHMFKAARSFNGDISKWDVSS